jgi:aryl-alcohol dehydrogenase-like predicted oxidoreductase
MIDRQVWFLTGAGRGMGVDFAKAALAAGHQVVATGRTPDTVRAAIGEAGDTDHLLVVRLDVAGDQRFGAAGFTEAEIAVGREVDRLSRAWGLAPYQVSLAWLLSRPAVASAIVGAESLDELRANATAADVELEPAQLDSLTALASEPAAFYHRAGQGPERPASTTDPVPTD